MPLREHPTGNYRFLSGIAPYSCGVVASPGFEIVHVTLMRPALLPAGFERIASLLKDHDRPLSALCAIELRSPQPYSFAGFAEFNAGYAETLQAWQVFVNGVNPVARTNVAPALLAPPAPALFGFSFTRPCSSSSKSSPTFVVAGAGELPEGVLTREGIVALGDVSPAGLETKATFVMQLMAARLRGLGVDWRHVNRTQVYTIHDFGPLLSSVLLSRLGPAASQGVVWHYARPPVEEIEFEMDLRGTRTELWLD